MRRLIASVGMALSIASGFAADVYVSPTGKDTNDGSKAAPKATLTSALRQAREMRRLGAEVESGINIHLAGGDYYLYEPVFIRPEDSGTATSPTVITSSGDARLNGGVRIEGGSVRASCWWPTSPVQRPSARFPSALCQRT